MLSARIRWALGCALPLAVSFAAWFVIAPRFDGAPNWLLTTAMAQRRCLNADLSACTLACERGIGGADGCLGAQEDERACALGVLDGCTLAIAASPDSRARELEPAPRLVGLYERACELGDAGSCHTVGGLYLGKDSVRAVAAYTRWCQATEVAGAAVSCVSERRASSERAAALWAACEANEVQACSALGVLLLKLNPERALVAFARECALRGLDQEQLYPDTVLDCATGMPSWYLHGPRTAAARCAREHAMLHLQAAPVTQAAVATPARDGSQHGQVAFTLVRATPAVNDQFAVLQAQFTQRAQRVGRCYERALGDEPTLAGTSRVRLVIDRLGDPDQVQVWPLVPTGAPRSVHPFATLADCARTALSVPGLSTGREAPVVVDAELRFSR